MQIDATHSDLQNIPINRIDRNPENPRTVFRPKELEHLLESIRRYGVQVPVSVYRKKGRFVLIDGERRWRCSIKLGLKTIPALVQDEPGPLTNLLLMFNIHALREQWDLLTIALKLPRVIDLLVREKGWDPNERELADHTGLPRGTIRRCKLLMDLPRKYQRLILDELNKPKIQQKLTEDFFIEMERALKTTERALPSIIPNKDRVRQILIRKYRNGTIVNILDFRKISKIARAQRVEVGLETAEEVLKQLFEWNDYSVEQAFQDSVSEAYSERDLLTRIRSVLDRLEVLKKADLDDELRSSLKLLIERVSRLLGSPR
jgi:ParB family transcriptional regulator, chromosome partitioning protein